ncbi:MAG: 50S ribosomal protein L23 [Candidatus Brocadia sp. AMX2]|uniref:Large ribosomal subunit protein uL23 n=1 Tax=Candidatus Brocadia sinica JPN1 TaxID=1197129 RepID=A0ABQ0JY00_9BACT|nr:MULTISPECIES: 50S ribosomal protein L23 [Brocadia]KXK26362.1 MAG: 50S ribosomal protein L23 [Candidatus Brocadia sinica]MBC6932934.1 50S ribosomal protein L23 [Candidatus Brocadia sp.]MBL1167580.1 50S ribosomal protein L23 [Candidatus Brocadia sp. AMX1]NOG40530.1 50S ribosomal protein L23 [Planctomycetota bacterium]KAA0242043.1 MAG: 50S ribosomal protein L23 [Candidatus Brocadia sp. AMX2]
MNSYQIIKRPLRTEKSVADGQATNSYHFEVDLRANKIQIKQAIEKFFSVKVDDVRTLVRKGKSRRVRFKLGRTKDWKKAIVTLKEGNTIDLGY